MEDEELMELCRKYNFNEESVKFSIKKDKKALEKQVNEVIKFMKGGKK